MGEYLRRNGRLLLAALVIVLFCAALPGLFAAGQAIETGSWGLSFRAEGKEPVGNASKQALQSYDAVYVGDGNEKVVYLTFDAGYENGYTASILDALKAHNAPACFFVVGNYLETAPDLVRRMVNEGHIVGNHTYHHYDMSKISGPGELPKRAFRCGDALRADDRRGHEKYYRPPQGIYSEENLQMAKDLGYRTVFWSLAYVDWYQDDQPTKEQAFSKLLPRDPSGRDRAAALDVQHERGNSRCASYKVGGHGLPVREPRRAFRDRRVMEPIAGRCITWNERATDATLYFRRFRYVLQ
ncbi:MAG: polysaccharide deacetylase family protein [Oscillospiraceae bacterium]